MIFVCSYDPFDRGRMVYTIRNMCEEVPEMEYDDGLRTVFLNTKGMVRVCRRSWRRCFGLWRIPGR